MVTACPGLTSSNDWFLNEHHFFFPHLLFLFLSAVRRLQDEWALEQRATEQKMAEMVADMEKMKAAYTSLQEKEKVGKEGTGNS